MVEKSDAKLMQMQGFLRLSNQVRVAYLKFLTIDNYNQFFIDDQFNFEYVNQL